MSHTPGPWVIDGYGAILVPGGERLVLNGVQWTQSSDPAMRAQHRANQALVSAAPDLLEALKDVLRIAKAASIGVTGNAPRIAKAEAAIAKAEGR